MRGMKEGRDRSASHPFTRSASRLARFSQRLFEARRNLSVFLRGRLSNGRRSLVRDPFS